MKEDESIIDVVFQLRTLLLEQAQQIQMLQASINLIGAKVNDKIYPDFSAPKGVESKPAKSLASLYQPGETISEVTHPSAPVASPPPAPSSIPTQRKNVKVFGNLEDQSRKALSGVVVEITDANNNVVKQTKTNRGGLWMSFLPPGSYNAEFSIPGMQSEAVSFQLFEGQKEVEV